MRALEDVKAEIKNQIFDRMVLFDTWTKQKLWIGRVVFVLGHTYLLCFVFVVFALLVDAQTVSPITKEIAKHELMLGSMAVMTFVLLFLIWNYRVLNKKTKVYFKKELISRVIQCIDPTITFHENAYIQQNQYKNSGLCVDHIEKYSGEDHFRGKVGEIEYEFCELRIRAHSLEPEYANKVTLNDYSRLFFRIVFPKRIADLVTVFQNHSFVYKNLGGYIPGENPMGKRIVMPNEEFNKMFAVYSADKSMVYYALTTEMMEAIIQLKKRIRGEIQLSFTDHHMYISVSMHKDLFEYNSSKPLAESEPVEEIYNLIHFVHTAVAELNVEINSKIKAEV
jgi:Protein of unknown function (DUF3137)